MASIEAIVNKRVSAVERIKAALPGISFRPTKGGPEYQHADDLEQVANFLESQGAARVSRRAAADEGTPAS